MRYGIVSDIHANLEAFEKVLDVLSKEKIDRYVCVGDIIGYGADPNACVEITKGLEPLVIMGNHDSACAGITSLSYFNAHAKEAVVWTKGVLDRAHMAYLKTLDLIMEEGAAFTPLEKGDGSTKPPSAQSVRERSFLTGFTIVHGTLDDPESFNYMVDTYQARRSFEKMRTQILFVGHSHIPGIFELENNKMRYFYAQRIKLSPGIRYIINAGSVGQPRDGDNRACFMIYDTGTDTVDINRVEYDVRGAQKKILEAGLPSGLAYRLESGT